MIVPEPCYVAYEPCIAFAGGVPVRVPTRADDGFAVDAAVVEAAVTPRTKAVLLGSPANPTGAVQPRSALEALVRLAERHDLYLVSDEIYDRLTYDTAHTCLGALAPNRTVLLGGFSKAHAMTGWRVGWICAPRAVAELCVRVHQYTMLCAPHVSQMAAVEALSGPDDDVAAMVADYDRRRRVFVKGLREIGLRLPRARRGVLRLPFDPRLRHGLRDVRREAPARRGRRRRARAACSDPPARAMCAARTPPRCPCLEEALTRMDRFLRSDHRDSDGQ